MHPRQRIGAQFFCGINGEIGSARTARKLVGERESRGQFADTLAHFFGGVNIITSVKTSAIMSAIAAISGSRMPRVVTAGVPRRTPLALKGRAFQTGWCSC